MSDPAAVAPPPPAVVPSPGGEGIPPPARAALEPVVGAAPSASVPLPPVPVGPFSVVAEIPDLADDDNEDISVVAELSNTQVAAELSHFMEHLLTPRRQMGIAAFVLFSIVFMKRVRIWYADTSEDIVARYAP